MFAQRSVHGVKEPKINDFLSISRLIFSLPFKYYSVFIHFYALSFPKFCFRAFWSHALAFSFLCFHFSRMSSIISIFFLPSPFSPFIYNFNDIVSEKIFLRKEFEYIINSALQNCKIYPVQQNYLMQSTVKFGRILLV